MSFMDTVGDLLKQYESGAGAPSREQAQEHYDQIANNVPKDVLASTIGPALGDLDTQELEERIRRSAAQMDPQQKANLLGTILRGLGASAALPDVLRRIGVSPAVAQNPQQASPEEVAKVAAYAKENQPDLFHRAMGFYAQHPTLVKVMGTLAIAAIARNLAGGRRPGLV